MKSPRISEGDYEERKRESQEFKSERKADGEEFGGRQMEFGGQQHDARMQMRSVVQRDKIILKRCRLQTLGRGNL